MRCPVRLGAVIEANDVLTFRPQREASTASGRKRDWPRKRLAIFALRLYRDLHNEKPFVD
jgi:hypothetical protein